MFILHEPELIQVMRQERDTKQNINKESQTELSLLKEVEDALYMVKNNGPLRYVVSL